MKHRLLMFGLALGAVAGFTSGVFGCRNHGQGRQQAFEDHVADVCTRAAERSRHAPDSRPIAPNEP